MSEKIPNNESNEKVDLNNERLLQRLERFYLEVPELKDDFLVHIIQIAGGNNEISRQAFNEVCYRTSIRPETLLDWDDAYFEEQFEDTVAIILERRHSDIV